LEAEAQTYNGWVKLPLRGGWVLAFDPESEPPAPVLRCISQEELQMRRSELARSALDGFGQDAFVPSGPMAAGRRARLDLGLCSPSEFRLLEGSEALMEQRPRNSDADAAGAPPAQVETRLRALVDAAGSGNAAAIRDARNAAKRAGVPSSAIARAFALRSC